MQIAWDLATLPRLDCNPPILAHVRDRFALGLAAGVFRSSLDSGPHPDSEALLAVTGPAPADIVGFATFYETECRHLWLHLLWVDEPYRRQGIAHDLLEQLEMITAERGMKGVMLGRAPEHPAMAALLERAGWPVDHFVHLKPIGA